MGIVIFSIVFHNYLTALFVSFLIVLILILTLLLLFVRYNHLPIVREKHDLQRKILPIRSNLEKAEASIHEAMHLRDKLVQNEQDDLKTTLASLQRDFIQQGLESVYIKDATIPGIGPKLKERLVAHSIVTAAHISENIARIPGFGEAKQQALNSWRNMLFVAFDASKPISLPDEQLRNVRQKHQALLDQNDLAAKKAQARK